MRYITPETLVKNRVRDNPLPQWFAAVLSFHGSTRSHPLIQEFNAKPLGYRVFYGMEESDIRETVINGKRIGVLAPCSRDGGGGPKAASLVEELSCLGVKYLVGYGPAGGIIPEFPKGQQFVVSSGLTTDGTSRIYCPDMRELAPDPELMELAIAAGEALSCKMEKATAATVDALYRETEELMSEWRAQGAQIINMEITPFYAASRVCGAKSVWLGHVSDRLLKGEWESWFAGRSEMASMSARICREFVNSLTKHHG
jgi:uridine phosphorylase